MLAGRLSEDRRLRTSDALKTGDSKERAPNTWFFKARLPWKKSGRVASSDVKKLDEVGAARLRAWRDNYLDSHFIAFNSEQKSVDDVFAWGRRRKCQIQQRGT